MAQIKWHGIIESAFRLINSPPCVVGWHHRFNRLAKKPNVHLYRLIQLLHKEAKRVRLQVRLVAGGKLQATQRLPYRKLQDRLFQYWDEYEKRERMTYSLLRACAALYGQEDDDDADEDQE